MAGAAAARPRVLPGEVLVRSGGFFLLGLGGRPGAGQGQPGHHEHGQALKRHHSRPADATVAHR
jgi:hypothetical protein